MRFDVTRRGTLALAAAFGAHAAAAAPSAAVLASFTVLADLTRAICPPSVRVSAIAGVGADPHHFEPRPSDAAALASARLLVVNGLSFDDWAERFAEAVRFAGPVVRAAAQVPVLRKPGGHHGGVDPHAWLDVTQARQYVRTIAAGLAIAIPSLAVAIRSGAARYDLELAALDRDVRRYLSAVPVERRLLVTPHDSFGHFGRAYGFRTLALRSAAGRDSGSAAQAATAIRTIRTAKLPAVFVERTMDARAIKQVGEDAGVPIGGRLYTDTLSQAGGLAPTYIALMRHNARTIAAALA